jgi:hypothetical protein
MVLLEIFQKICWHIVAKDLYKYNTSTGKNYYCSAE